MEDHHSQVIHADVLGESIKLVENKICAGTVCRLSDSINSSKDAQERSESIRKLIIAVLLCIVFMTVEVAGGIKANSLAILTDAAHLLSDVAAFAISLFSIWASGWEANPRQSYGFYRIEILGALVSIQLIWLLTGILVYEAIVRLIHETGEVQGVLMFAVSTFGLVVNIIMTVLLGHDHGHGGHGHSHGKHGHGHNHDDHDNRHSIENHHHDRLKEHNHDHEHEPVLNYSQEDRCTDGTEKKQHNVNIHSAFLHVLGDSVQSAGVMIGGAIIWYKPELKIIDLVCTLIFSVIVLATTVRMLRNIIEVLMESTPREVDSTRLGRGLCEMDGVVEIHELHIWALTVGKIVLACHVMINPEADSDLVLNKVINYIKREFNISHVTIQIERLQLTVGG